MYGASIYFISATEKADDPECITHRNIVSKLIKIERCSKGGLMVITGQFIN